MNYLKANTLLLVFLFTNLLTIASNTDILDSLHSELFKDGINTKSEAKVLSEIADAYYKSKDYPHSLNYLNQALDIYNKTEDQTGIGITYKRIGDIYSEVNDYDNSLKYYLDALTIFETLTNKPKIALINLDLGRLFIKLEDFNKAIEKLNISLVYYEKHQKKEADNLINNYANIGIAHGTIGSLDSALIYFNKALSMYPEDDFTNRAGVLNNIGAIYYKQGEYDKALNKYEKALELFRSSDNSKGIGISLFNIAQIYLKKKDIDMAELLFEETIPYLEKSESLYYLDNCYLQLSTYNEEKGDIAKSLKYYKLYTAIKDSIMNIETLNKVASLQMQYDVRKVEHKLEILEKDNKIKAIQEYFLIGSIVLLLIIGGLIFRTLKSRIKTNKLKQEILRQEKKQLKDELKYKNKELETFALQIVQKNEFLESLKNEIKDISEDSGKLREISVNIKQNLYLEKDREEFQHHLDNIHQSFFLRLDQKFPTLSKNEKRLCSLLAIDLSTKDIATITNISPDSVKKSRYRLRKKLGLETEDNLAEYLKQI